MRSRSLVLVFAIVGLALGLGSWMWFGNDASRDPEIHAPTFALVEHGHGALLPLPAVPQLTKEQSAKVALGKQLFFEVRLSGDDTLSCASCHDFTRGGADRRKVAVGVGGKFGPINTPTVFNSGLNFVQFWDGRAPSLEEQAAGPVHSPLEMASNWAEVIPKLSQLENYRLAFSQVYPQDGISGKTIVDAIAAYERTLLTPSRFDQYLRGQRDVLSKLEQTGYQRFLDYGCASCHQGAGVGGNMYQRFGVMGDYFAGRQVNDADLGRYNVTKRDFDRHVFKVPSLRNVAVTAPYFHDASVATLEEAVVIMARYQLGRSVAAEDVAAIVAFLQSLTGDWEGRTLQ